MLLSVLLLSCSFNSSSMTGARVPSESLPHLSWLLLTLELVAYELLSFLAKPPETLGLESAFFITPKVPASGPRFGDLSICSAKFMLLFDLMLLFDYEPS